MVKATGAKVLLHTDDLALLKKLNSYTMMVGLPEVEVPTVNEFIQDGAVLRLGKQEIKVLHTPGHTEGGCSFFVENMLFSGDTLFQESIGRTDLEGGDFSTLKNSIETKIYTLPEDTKVYPGHGPSTSIEHEKKFNSYI
jgi:glyoxylase-like metal-dependent hydrolase (beta-lactamase superfamily II)